MDISMPSMEMDLENVLTAEAQGIMPRTAGNQTLGAQTATF